MAPYLSTLFVIRDCNLQTRAQNFTIEFPPSHPPEVYFDTNVWLSMSDAEADSLQIHKAQRGYRYRYSITNYVEMLSRLGRGPTKRFPNPFGRVRAAFRRVQRLCDPEVLPAPEMTFLDEAGLSHYLSPTWIPNPQQTAIAVSVIARAETMGDITGIGIQTLNSVGAPRWIVDPMHYTRLTDIDDASATSIIQRLNEYTTKPITKENIERIVPWFQHLAKFFLLFRPSSGRVKYEDLSPDERNRFWEGLTHGAGQVFQAHMTLVAVNTMNRQHSIDPNDIYDAMQLLLLNGNRLFVTNDTDFIRYSVDATIHHVVPWAPFKQPPPSRRSSF